MHDTAFELGKLFFETYCPNTKLKILDIGSLNVNGSLRSVSPAGCEYIGVDFEAGDSVDVVIEEDSQNLPFDDASFDSIVSTSCFEHDEFFWVTFNEMTRVLKPGGFIYINAPSNGPYHRYPSDNWRFYPDAGVALQKWSMHCHKSVVLMESFISETKKDVWNDFVAVFKAPQMAGEKNSRYLSDVYKDCFNLRRQDTSYKVLNERQWHDD